MGFLYGLYAARLAKVDLWWADKQGLWHDITEARFEVGTAAAAITSQLGGTFAGASGLTKRLEIRFSWVSGHVIFRSWCDVGVTGVLTRRQCCNVMSAACVISATCL